MAKFIAIDGEADNRGRYIILCDSEGRVLYNPDGITTTEAFGFILSLPRKTEIVCYGLNYDVNQWLRDIPRPTLEHIAADNRCVWRGEYKLEWIPSKMFSVRVPGKSITVCEVFGFFQTSFVKALQQWGFTPPAEVERMKQRRGSFTRKEVERVIAYCQAECKLLVALMQRLEAACEKAGCVPRGRWIGAGAIASSLMKSHRVTSSHAYDADLFGRDLTDNYVLRAYFGGRVELYSQGWRKNMQAADIRSAYPYAALQLPSLHDAEVRQVTEFDWHQPYSLWRVSWMEGLAGGKSGGLSLIAPFPVRLSHGEICYPMRGEGVYHWHEVKAAIKAGYRVHVHDGLIITPGFGSPFDWIREVYNHRAELKEKGDNAEKALKLGLNSIYGKMAQGYGYGNRPPFQSYYWAGFITSLTRARMLERLVTACSPVMCATDGVVASTVIGSGNTRIGSWEVTGYERVATIQPGVYVADYNGQRIIKSRGFFARDVDYDAMLARFHNDSRSCYHFDSRRFIGLKVALHRKDFSLWRQWIEERRSIAFEIKNKNAVIHNEGVTLYPITGPYDSLPYEPKQSLYDDPSDDKLENLVRDDQPHREVD